MEKNQRRYDNVPFEFLSAGDEPTVSGGTAIVREEGMVLEVEWPGDRPYLIEGKRCRGFWAGCHKGFPGDVPVEAKWIQLNDIFIGIWVEDGIDYTFTLHLARASEVRLRCHDSKVPPEQSRVVESVLARALVHGGG